LVMKYSRAFSWGLALLFVLSACDGGGGAGAPADGSIDAPVTCSTPQVACAGRCVDVSSDAVSCGACGHACAVGMACVAGTCQLHCPAGQMACGGACTSMQTDLANCGACGHACPTGQVCSMGACGLTCDASLATCSASSKGADG